MFELETDDSYLAASLGGSANGSGPRVERAAMITGLAAALPETVVPNAPIAERLGVSPDWITARTGVVERRVAGDGEMLIDFAFAASQAAIAEARIDPTEIDMVLVATCTYEMLCPSASAVLAAKLGTGHAAALDINAACSGFLSGLSTATAQIESGRARQVLVVGADLMHRVIDFDDRSTAGIFADGAGAAVLSAGEGSSRIGPVLLASDGALGHLVEASRAEAIIQMKGHDTFREAVKRLEEVTLAAAESVDVDLGDIDLFAYHQANSRIIEAVGVKLDLDPEKVIDCVPSYGNTSAASIPIALTEARTEGRLNPGDRVLLGAFGGGLTWGATVIEWGSP